MSSSPDVFDCEPVTSDAATAASAKLPSFANPEFSAEFRERVDRERMEREKREHQARIEEIERSFPTPLMRKTTAPEEYPVDALGPVLGPAARAIAEIKQVPLATAANSVLATAALAAQSHCNVQTLGGVKPLSLFVLTVSGSSDRKSSADEVALAPVQEHARRLTVAYKAAMKERKAQAEARKVEVQKARQAVREGKDQPAAAPQDDESPPRAPKLICTEPTAEGLMRSLTDGQYGQGIYSDEGGQFLGGHALSDEAQLRTVAMLSRAWQGSPLDRVRALNNEHIVLYGRRLSMHLMVQPKVAGKLLGNELYRSQGFLARFLLAAPDSLAGTRLYDAAAPEVQDDPRVQRYWRAIGELLERPPLEDHEVGGLSPSCLSLLPEARELLIDAYNDLERSQAKGAPLEPIREWAGKAAEHACRIAGVLSLAADQDALYVTGETMRDALVVMQFYLSEYQRLVGTSAPPDHLVRAQALLEWLHSTQKITVTAREVMRTGPKSLRRADLTRQALQILAREGWLSPDRAGKVFTVHVNVTLGALT